MNVAPIFNARCVSCHRPGEIAPMSLTTFESPRPWARAIRKAVDSRTMPPWYADAKYGQFANDPRLSNEDVATIAAWVDGGMFRVPFFAAASYRGTARVATPVATPASLVTSSRSSSPATSA